MDIDALAAQFGSNSKAPPADNSSGIDINGLAAEFGSKGEAKPLTKVIIRSGEPHPPQSDINGGAPEYYDSTNVNTEKGGYERVLPRTNIGESIQQNFESGKELAGQAVSDFSEGHPYKAVGKGLLGATAMAMSPVTGLVEGGVGTPVTDITGNPDIGDRAAMVAGSVLPVAKIGKAAVEAIPKNKAFSSLVESISPDKAGYVAREMRANPRLAPADLSPKVLQDTQNLFASDGPQINYLAKTSADRMAGRQGAMIEAYDTAGGISPNLAQKVSDLAQASKSVGMQKIQPALDAAKPVDVSNTVSAIDKILKPGVNSVITGESSLPLTAVKKELAQIKGMLANDTEMRTGAKDLHKFQSGLRATAEGLLKSSSGADRQMGKSLMDVRNNLVNDIDKSAHGYKEGLSAYRDEKDIAEAFKQGHDNTFTSSKKIENDPSFTQKWFDGLSDYEKQAAREGARAAIYTEMGVAKNPALAGESIARSEFNKAKMEIIFGKDEATTLLKKLADERTIANTHNKIIENSQTAMRMASKQQFALPTKGEIGQGLVVGAGLETANILAHGTPGVGTALLAAAKTGNWAKHEVLTKLAREHNAQYAKLALPTEGPSRDQLIRQLEAVSRSQKPSIMNRAAGLARLVGP
jgi:hypothetical protein